MPKKFYVTTPIYYGNGIPHVGHFYSSTIANVFFLRHKNLGEQARFTTGIDENSQKAVLKAQEEGKSIMDYLDSMAEKHKEVWDYFHIQYTDFIRTTEPRHHALVKEVLQKCFDRGDIYEGRYHGMYCIGCEAFKKEDDLIERDGKKVCPDHLKEPDKVDEKNYFFKLSRYQTWIEELYETQKDFVLPDFRFNEVKAFVKRGLEDFSISRETNTFGIPLPFDQSQVTYVWFDALFNYYTSCRFSRGGDKSNETFTDESESFWMHNPHKIHIVGKDIIRFHAIFWPCMLASYFGLGKEKDGVLHYSPEDSKFLPSQILTTGYFTVDGQKMSKSLGNVIEPIAYSEQYSKELLILYMLSGFPIGSDGDYSKKDAILTFNAKLANNLGNLVNRVVVLALKMDGVLDARLSEIDDSYFALQIQKEFDAFHLKGVLDTAFKFLDEVNKYTDEKEPWKMIKDAELNKETLQVLSSIAESLRQVGLVLYPFFPEKMTEMFAKLGISDYSERLMAGELEKLIQETPEFKITEKGAPLFARLEVE